MEDLVPVTIAAPDVQIDGITGRRANLFLCDINENAYLKNQQIPGEGHPAEYGNPALSLDLRYLVTAHGETADGADADLQAQQVLGDAMRVFHEYPIITDNLHEDDNPGNPLILDASLVGEFERLKITLLPNQLEELSKLWMAQPDDASFHRSVIYQVSVIQIDSRRRRRSSLPVRRRAVYAIALEFPFIEELFRETPLPPQRSAVVEAGDTLVIVGRNLAGLSTRVRIGTESVSIASPQKRRIELVVPNTLTAGAHTVQVVHDVPMLAETGQPLVPHRGFESNVLPLLVLPTFQAIAPGAASAGDQVTVTVAPAVSPEQTRTLLVGASEIPGDPVAIGSAPSTSLEFTLPSGAAAVPPGNYLARVRVDGAESRLSFDPTTGVYTGPTLTVNP